MTGPEHFRESQWLLSEAQDKRSLALSTADAGDAQVFAEVATGLATAGAAHATLAMVALQASTIPLGEKADAAWHEAGAW